MVLYFVYHKITELKYDLNFFSSFVVGICKNHCKPTEDLSTWSTLVWFRSDFKSVLDWDQVSIRF